MKLDLKLTQTEHSEFYNIFCVFSLCALHQPAHLYRLLTLLSSPPVHFTSWTVENFVLSSFSLSFLLFHNKKKVIKCNLNVIIYLMCAFRRSCRGDNFTFNIHCNAWAETWEKLKLKICNQQSTGCKSTTQFFKEFARKFDEFSAFQEQSQHKTWNMCEICWHFY